jgi:ABC-type glycerol-3-phosphate transport system substrate-binding protein
MNRFIISFLIAVMAISGCGEAGSAAKKDAGITMWLVGTEAQALAINAIAADFYKKTGIDVKCDAISWADAHSKYLTSIAGGVAPDIGTMGLTWGAEFGSMDAMVDLKEAHPEDIAAIKESVFQGIWDSIERSGKVYGIPFDMTEYVMYYRSDIISDPPETWKELTDLLVKLSAAGKGMIFDWGSMSWIGYSPFLWQAGGSYYNSDYSEVTVDSPEAALALGFFAGLYKNYGVPKTKVPLEQGMRTGDFPIAISGNWKIDELRISAPEIAGKWSISVLPKGPSGKATSFIGGRIMGVFSQSKKKDASWQFIKYLFSPDIQKKLHEAALAEQDTYLPPSRKTWGMIRMDEKFKTVLTAQALDAKGPPAISNWDACTKALDEAIQKVILQDADPAKELAAAKVQLKRLTRK